MLSNGKEAIDFFATTVDPPELVLLDINMPLINGFEFLDYYNTKGWNGRTKFAVYSTSSRDEDKEKSMKYNHVIDYIEKPLTADGLGRKRIQFSRYLLRSVCSNTAAICISIDSVRAKTKEECLKVASKKTQAHMSKFGFGSMY